MTEAGEKGQTFKLGAYGFLMTLLFLELFVFAWCRMQCVTIGYDLSEAWKEQSRLLERQEAMKVEMAHLRSPDRIMKIGEQRLGLVMPRSEQVKVVGYDLGG